MADIFGADTTISPKGRLDVRLERDTTQNGEGPFQDADKANIIVLGMRN